MSKPFVTPDWNFPGKNAYVGCHFISIGHPPYPGIEPKSPAHISHIANGWTAQWLGCYWFKNQTFSYYAEPSPGFTAKFYQTFKEVTNMNPSQPAKDNEEEELFQLIMWSQYHSDNTNKKERWCTDYWIQYVILMWMQNSFKIARTSNMNKDMLWSIIP